MLHDSIHLTYALFHKNKAASIICSIFSMKRRHRKIKQYRKTWARVQSCLVEIQFVLSYQAFQYIFFLIRQQRLTLRARSASGSPPTQAFARPRQPVFGGYPLLFRFSKVPLLTRPSREYPTHRLLAHPRRFVWTCSLRSSSRSTIRHENTFERNEHQNILTDLSRPDLQPSVTVIPWSREKVSLI